MAKTKYVVTFSNGKQMTRSSERTYTHVWAILNDKNEIYASGFCGSLDLAKKAVNQCLPTDHEAAFKKKNKYRSTYDRQSTLKWLKEYHEGSWAKYQDNRQAILATLRTEIVAIDKETGRELEKDPYGRNHIELAHDAAGTQY